MSNEGKLVVLIDLHYSRENTSHLIRSVFCIGNHLPSDDYNETREYPHYQQVVNKNCFDIGKRDRMRYQSPLRIAEYRLSVIGQYCCTRSCFTNYCCTRQPGEKGVGNRLLIRQTCMCCRYRRIPDSTVNSPTHPLCPVLDMLYSVCIPNKIHARTPVKGILCFFTRYYLYYNILY